MNNDTLLCKKQVRGFTKKLDHLFRIAQIVRTKEIYEFNLAITLYQIFFYSNHVYLSYFSKNWAFLKKGRILKMINLRA